MAELDNSVYDEEMVAICEEIELEDNLLHLCKKIEKDHAEITDQFGAGVRQVGEAVKRNATEHGNPQYSRKRLYAQKSTSTGKATASPPNPETEPSVSSANLNSIKCPTCEIFVNKRYFTNHLKSNRHKNNVFTLIPNLNNVQLIEKAFGQRLVTYRVFSNSATTDTDFKTPESFLGSIRSTVQTLLEKVLKENTTVKVNFILNGDFVQATKNLENSFDFQTFNYMFCLGDEFDDIYSNISSEISNKISNFEKKDSGWSLKEMRYVDLNINKFNPLKGSSYIDLPIDIKRKRAVVNVKNNDYQCFLWAVLSALYPVNRNADRVSSYLSKQNLLNFKGIAFPVRLKDIIKFERLNNISINVFGIEKSNNKSTKIIGPLHFTKCRKLVHVNLLYLDNGSNGHYCYIKNLSRLVSRQLTSHEHAVYICDGCLLYFQTNDKLISHRQFDCNHVRIDLPDISKAKISFNKFERELRVPFVIYADFEAFLKPIQGCDNNPSLSYTSNFQKHDVYSFGYYIKCAYNDSLSKYITYTGSDCAKVFMESLNEDLKYISKEYYVKVDPHPLTDEAKRRISLTTTCYICKESLKLDRSLNFDKYTGIFTGVSHKACCKKLETPRFIPIILHNLSNYDAHFVVRALNFAEGDIKVIPQNKERYISFSKILKIENQNFELRFIDSFKFLSCSLESLSNNLNDEDFIELRKNFQRPDDFYFLKRKGIYPYDYMTSFESLKLTSLPTQDQFYNILTNSDVTNENYNHAKDVWHHFNCRNMADYSDLYLKTDVLLLTDIFENFRNVCIKTYDLDPAQYYTAPGLSWDAMLKHTKITLDLLTDFDKIAFIKSGIRGGISQCSNRYAHANNKYMFNFSETTPTSYLTYLDANNLYGWAMSQYLPTGEFQWVNCDTNFKVPIDSEIGYILEVDLEYPQTLHESHSDFPLCPENICIGGSKETKLVPNLYDKTKYVIHYRNLIQCIEMGLKLKKVHRILKFRQSPWLQKYIDLNTQLRMSATSDFEKDFYKLMNNSIFGKTMENVEKRVDVKLCTHWENRGKCQGAQNLVARPEFHSLSIFSENLVAVQLKKTKILYNKPIYLGLCILDISKTLMYDFHYNYMKNKYGSRCKMMYTDTDSFIYQIFTNDFYEDIKPDLNKYFDTSDYPFDNLFGFPQINKKKIGFFKDENNGKIFTEFVGLRSKMYAMNVQNKFIAKAKGVNKSATKKFNMRNYKNVLFNKNNQICEMYRFRSIKHVIFTQKANKISLSHSDTKRFLISNCTDTLAWGHYKINSYKSDE